MMILVPHCQAYVITITEQQFDFACLIIYRFFESIILFLYDIKLMNFAMF